MFDFHTSVKHPCKPWDVGDSLGRSQLVDLEVTVFFVAVFNMCKIKLVYNTLAVDLKCKNWACVLYKLNMQCDAHQALSYLTQILLVQVGGGHELHTFFTLLRTIYTKASQMFFNKSFYRVSRNKLITYVVQPTKTNVIYKVPLLSYSRDTSQYLYSKVISEFWANAMGDTCLLLLGRVLLMLVSIFRPTNCDNWLHWSFNPLHSEFHILI